MQGQPRARFLALGGPDGVAVLPRMREEVRVYLESALLTSACAIPAFRVSTLSAGLPDLLAAQQVTDHSAEGCPGQSGHSAEPQVTAHTRKRRGPALLYVR